MLAYIQQAESLVSFHVVPSCFHGSLRCLNFVARGSWKLSLAIGSLCSVLEMESCFSLLLLRSRLVTIP